MADNNQLEKVKSLIKDARMAMLTTMTPEGKHVSRPMAVQDTDFDGDMWFFTYDTSNKIDQIKSNPEVNVSFSNNSNNSWTSVSGNAEQVTDHDKMKELWNPLLKAWFPDELETDGITLIKVHADSAEYWDSPNSTALNLFGMAKAAITGKPPKGGENKSVDL